MTEIFTAEEIAEIKTAQEITNKFYDKAKKAFARLYKEIINNPMLNDLFSEIYGDDAADEDTCTLYEEFIMGEINADTINVRINEMAAEMVEIFYKRVKENSKKDPTNDNN